MTIAVYGASGYQGKLVVAELARRGIGTVLVGRNPTRLRMAAEQAGVPDAETRAVAIDDTARLAGPFIRSGDALVRAAINGRLPLRRHLR